MNESENLELYMEKLEDIADAIRFKNGESGKYTLEDMPQKILDIPSENHSQDTYRPIIPPDAITNVTTLSFTVQLIEPQQIIVEPEVNENVL